MTCPTPAFSRHMPCAYTIHKESLHCLPRHRDWLVLCRVCAYAPALDDRVLPRRMRCSVRGPKAADPPTARPAAAEGHVPLAVGRLDAVRDGRYRLLLPGMCAEAKGRGMCRPTRPC